MGKLGFLTGKVCVASGGKADSRLVVELIGEHLGNSVA
jgi:Asp-tRNA(Asn)/Glu-tRNA(Gln) amidotransferase B subunit